MSNIQNDLKIGDALMHTKLSLDGRVMAIDGDEVTVNWLDGNDVMEEILTVDEACSAKGMKAKGFDKIKAPGNKVKKEEVVIPQKDPEKDTETEDEDDPELLGEKYVGFNKLKAKIAAKGGVRNPGAVAAAIGRKKYGKDKFQKAAAEDHKMKGMKKEEEEIVEVSNENKVPGVTIPGNGKLRKLQAHLKKMKNMAEEETAAMRSLRPHGGAEDNTPKTKLEVMKAIIGEVGRMEDNEAVAFFHRSIAGIGHEGDPAPDASGSNRASVGMHASDAVGHSVKEEVAKLFEGQEITEEFKERTSTLFEAALSARVALAEAEIEATSAKILDEEVARLEEEFGEALAEIDEQTGHYLDYVAQKWMEENALAIESSLRSDLTRDFIEGMKNLFSEHYIDIPEDKVDVVEMMAEQVKTLESKLNDAIEEATDLRNTIAEVTAEEAFEEVAHGLAITEAEKFRTLCEDVEFEGDIDKFKGKLQLIRETHFNKATKKPVVKLDDQFSGDEKGLLTEGTDPRVARYVQALSKSQVR